MHIHKNWYFFQHQRCTLVHSAWSELRCRNHNVCIANIITIPRRIHDYSSFYSVASLKIEKTKTKTTVLRKLLECTRKMNTRPIKNPKYNLTIEGESKWIVYDRWSQISIADWCTSMLKRLVYLYILTTVILVYARLDMGCWWYWVRFRERRRSSSDEENVSHKHTIRFVNHKLNPIPTHRCVCRTENVSLLQLKYRYYAYKIICSALSVMN